MSSTLPIHFKATGEHFDVPYELQTTISQLIEYVCKHSVFLPNSNPESYYMAMNDSDLLSAHQTVEQRGLDQPNRYRYLSVCIKTRILIQRMLRSQAAFRQIPSEQRVWQTQQTSSVDESEQTPPPEDPPDTNATTSTENQLNSEVHILICGAPLVGKSSLINALVGCPVAKTNTIGLDSCTQKQSSYQLGNLFFWDTPGIQQWSQLDVNSYFNSSTRCQTPICMFYCASPGSFTKLKQLDILLDECIHQRKIFCVLVVTNMFAHINRYAILDEFKTILTRYIDNNEQIREEDGIWFYGKIGLCTMINSQEYVDEDTNQRKPPQGVNELVLALIKSLNGTNQLGAWLQTIEQNQKFWLEKQEEIYRLTEKPHGTCLSEMI